MKSLKALTDFILALYHKNALAHFYLITGIGPDEFWPILFESLKAKVVNHPDFLQIDGHEYLEQGLLTYLKTRPWSLNRKFVSWPSAETMPLHTANKLLKILEEEEWATFFFFVEDPAKIDLILPTIKSRAVTINIAKRPGPMAPLLGLNLEEWLDETQNDEERVLNHILNQAILRADYLELKVITELLGRYREQKEFHSSLKNRLAQFVLTDSAKNKSMPTYERK